jgi:hypothetical protein
MGGMLAPWDTSIRFKIDVIHGSHLAVCYPVVRWCRAAHSETVNLRRAGAASFPRQPGAASTPHGPPASDDTWLHMVDHRPTRHNTTFPLVHASFHRRKRRAWDLNPQVGHPT